MDEPGIAPETLPEMLLDGGQRRVARMAPEARREQLVDMAAEFFAENGFDAGTRQLAQRLGVTQPLIYRYFSSKDALINEVYRKVYVGQWQEGWTDGLQDRTRPMRARLTAFYCSYAPAIFNRRWMRIFFFAGLKGLDINARYLALVSDRLLTPIALEMRAELGLPDTMPPTREERELVWLMHGMVFYQGIREQIYRSVTAVDYDFAVNTAVGMYLDRAPQVVPQAVARARAGLPDRAPPACVQD